MWDRRIWTSCVFSVCWTNVTLPCSPWCVWYHALCCCCCCLETCCCLQVSPHRLCGQTHINIFIHTISFLHGIVHTHTHTHAWGVWIILITLVLDFCLSLQLKLQNWSSWIITWLWNYVFIAIIFILNSIPMIGMHLLFIHYFCLKRRKTKYCVKVSNYVWWLCAILVHIVSNIKTISVQNIIFIYFSFMDVLHLKTQIQFTWQSLAKRSHTEAAPAAWLWNYNGNSLWHTSFFRLSKLNPIKFNSQIQHLSFVALCSSFKLLSHCIFHPSNQMHEREIFYRSCLGFSRFNLTTWQQEWLFSFSSLPHLYCCSLSFFEPPPSFLLTVIIRS